MMLLAVLLASTITVHFDVAGMTCGMCETNAETALRGIKGVTKAEVDLESKKATVVATRDVPRAEIRKALAKYGFDAGFADAPLLQRLSDAERARLDIRVISEGGRFDVRKSLARGKFTIVDFWAEWCGPCHGLAPKLEHLVRDDARVALRTIDLKSWESDAAKQATEEYRLSGLPYVRVYAPDGSFLGAVVGNDIDKIKALINGARR